MRVRPTRRELLRSGAAASVGAAVQAHAAQWGLHLPGLSARTLLTAPVQVRSDFIGMHLHRWPSGAPLSPAPTYGFGAVRSHDYAGLPNGASWNMIHLGPNRFDWTALDLWVSTHAAQGRTLLYTVYGTPAWVTAAPGQKDPYGRPGASSPPRDLEPLHAFITALVQRYNARRTQIQYMEIWNEPHFEQNREEFWWGTAPQLAAMGRVIYQAAKAVDPRIHVLTPAFIAGATVPLVGEFRRFGNAPEAARDGSLYQYLTAADGAGGTGAQWCDGISFHVYSPHIGSATEGLEENIPLLKQLLASMHLNKPIYLTETGYFPNSEFARASLADKATTLQRLTVTVAALGVSTMYFYAHEDDFIGKPAFHAETAAAIDRMHRQLAGKTLQQVTIQADGSYQVATSSGTFVC